MISVTSTSSPPISGTFTSFTAEAVGAAATSASATTGAGTAPEPATSNTMIREPVVTLSPVATLISFRVPAHGAGTSIEALSPSTVRRDCSSSMPSPTATMISVTSTSSPPISGTWTSFSSDDAGAAAGASATAAGATSAAPSSESNTMISEPVDTLSPSTTLISLTIPAADAGTSIEALSPSTVIRDCSSSTLSPTLTRISVTSTSSAPISGTLISIAISYLPF